MRRHCNKINKAKSRPNQIEQHNLDIILDILILALAPPRIPTNFEVRAALDRHFESNLKLNMKSVNRKTEYENENECVARADAVPDAEAVGIN